MNTLFNQPLKVVNAGLHSFADNIQHAGGHAISSTGSRQHKVILTPVWFWRHYYAIHW